MGDRGKNHLLIAMECLRVTGNMPIYKNKVYESMTLPEWKSKRDKISSPEMPTPPASKDVSYEIDRKCRIVRADLTNLKDKKNTYKRYKLTYNLYQLKLVMKI